jgi:hypothetical protein
MSSNGLARASRELVEEEAAIDASNDIIEVGPGVTGRGGGVAAMVPYVRNVSPRALRGSVSMYGSLRKEYAAKSLVRVQLA